MTPRELLNNLNHIIEAAEIDADKEIVFGEYKDGGYVGLLEISRVDWLWDDPVDEGNYTKVLYLMFNRK